MSLEELLKMSERGFEKIKPFDRESTDNVEKLSNEMITFNKFLYTQFDTLQSTKLLMQKFKYKECFILLRSVFEGYLFLLQMVKGKDYLFTREFTIIPNPGNSNPKSRDDTYEKWIDDWTQEKIKDHDKIVSINKSGNDKILITYKFEGLYEENDIQQTGYWLSRYFFAFERYDPDKKFLLDLPSIQNISLYSKKVDNIKNIHSEIYHHVFFFDNIIKNLIRNALIDELQKDRIYVHYSFLSSFTHPTRRIIQDFGDPIEKYLKNGYDKVVDELILIYIVKLQTMYIELLLDFYKKVSSDVKWMEIYGTLITDLKKESDYFWFIFDESTDYDKAISDQEKGFIKKLRPEVYEKIKNIDIYYRNPLERLKDMKKEGFC